jgi:hypothetical protein
MGWPQSARVHFSLNVGRQIAHYTDNRLTSIKRSMQLRNDWPTRKECLYMSLAHWIFLYFVPSISIKDSYNFKNTDSKYNTCTEFYFHLKFELWTMGRVSSVRIETRYALDGPGIEPRWGRDFLHPSRLAPGPI